MSGNALRVAFALALSSTIAQAQDFKFENSTVTPGGQQISVVRLPIRMPDGKVVYKDVVMQFEFINNKFRFAEGYPKVTNSIIPQPGPFIAGNYKDGLGQEARLSGPLPGPNGRSRWTLRWHDLATFDFYTGAVDGHPLETRVEKAKINAPYTFGVVAQGSISTFKLQNLVALIQLDNRTLQVLDFTDDTAGKDSKTPVGSMEFQR